MTKPNDVVALIFSKNRPLQLDLLLNTFYLQCEQPYSTDIVVVYNHDEEYEESYETLFREQEEKERHNILFINDQNYVSFKNSFIHKIKNYDYILFLVDDNIFTSRFSLTQIKDLLFYNPNFLGFSLRLGKNTDHCYAFNGIQKIPESVEHNFSINMDSLNWLGQFFPKITYSVFSFNWKNSDLDFNYPLEISSSFYRMKDIYFLLKQSKYRNPNDLESQLYMNVWRFLNKPNLFSYNKSVAFCAPMNRVQNVALANRYSQIDIYSPESMLKMYENGFRIDPLRFNGFVSNGCHQEVLLYGEEEYNQYAE